MKRLKDQTSKDQTLARGRALAVLSSFVLVSIGFSAASPRAHPTTDDTTYSLARTYKAGDIDRYAIQIHTSVPDPAGDKATTKVTVDMVMKETTREIHPDGSVKLTDEFEKATIDVGESGHPEDATSLLPHVTQMRDSKGRVLDVKVEGGLIPPGAIRSLPRVLQSFYPPDSVKVGDSWKIDLNNPNRDDTAQETFKIVGTGQIVGLETVGGVETLKVKITTDSTYSAPNPLTPNKANTVKGHIDGDANIDPKTGKMMRMSSKTDGDGGAGDISLKLKTAADKDDDKVTTTKTGDAGKPDKKP